MPMRYSQLLRQDDVFYCRGVGAGRLRARKPAHRADLQWAFAVEPGGLRRPLLFLEHARAGWPGGERRHGCVRVCLVCVWASSGLRAGGRRTAADCQALARLETFLRARAEPLTLGVGAA